MNINIIEIGTYFLRNYLLETPYGIISIDTGYNGGFDRFKKHFEQYWSLEKLSHIVVTHHHDDHVGFLNELTAATNATVILHKKAIKYMAEGNNNMPPGSGYSSVPASIFGIFKKDFSFPPVKLANERMRILSSDANENEQYFEKMGLPIKIIYLPGHTDDSIGLFLTETGELFCGDAAMNAIISIARHTIWIDDAASFGASWDKMLSYRPTMIYPSHGNPFKPEDLVKYRHYMEKRRMYR